MDSFSAHNLTGRSLHNPALFALRAAAGRSLEGCGWGVAGVLGLGAGQQMAELARNAFRSAWIGVEEREACVAAVDGYVGRSPVSTT